MLYRIEKPFKVTEGDSVVLYTTTDRLVELTDEQAGEAGDAVSKYGDSSEPPAEQTPVPTPSDGPPVDHDPGVPEVETAMPRSRRPKQDSDG